MTQAVIIEKNGGPEELKLVDVQVGEPGPGEIRIRHKAIGLNFIDVYFREGRYPAALPFIPGQEAAGTVVAVGESTSGVKPGDRVVWCGVPGIAFTSRARLPTVRSRVVRGSPRMRSRMWTKPTTSS